MKSWKTPKPGIVIYFHLVPPEDKFRLMLLAGRGDIHDFPTVAMPHRLFSYLADTLRWIPTQFAPMARVPFERPVIGAEGALTARKIFGAWAQIFSTAAEVVLTVGVGFPAETLSVRRDDLVSCMSALEEFTHEVEGGQKVIYCSDTPDYRDHPVSEHDRCREVTRVEPRLAER